MFQDPGYFPDTLDSSISLTSHIKSIRNSCQFPLQKYLESARISLFVLSLPCPGLCNLWPAEAPPSSPGASFPLTLQLSEQPLENTLQTLHWLPATLGTKPRGPARSHTAAAASQLHLKSLEPRWLCTRSGPLLEYSLPHSLHTLLLPSPQFLALSSPYHLPSPPAPSSAETLRPCSRHRLHRAQHHPGPPCSSVTCQGLACCVPHDISSTLWVTDSWCMC